MDVRFNSYAAEALINDIKNYCNSIQHESKQLTSVINDSKGWNDNQNKAFQTNINEIVKDLETIISLETDYIKEFAHRVRELKE